MGPMEGSAAVLAEPLTSILDSIGILSSMRMAFIIPLILSPPKILSMLSSKLRKKRVLPGSPCLEHSQAGVSPTMQQPGSLTNPSAIQTPDSLGSQQGKACSRAQKLATEGPKPSLPRSAETGSNRVEPKTLSLKNWQLVLRPSCSVKNDEHVARLQQCCLGPKCCGEACRPSGSSPQLVVHPPGLVPLRAHHMQAPKLHHFLLLLVSYAFVLSLHLLQIKRASLRCLGYMKPPQDFALV